MRRLLRILSLLLLFPAVGLAQGVVSQGSPTDTTDAAAWPIKVVFGSSQIDPRAIRTLTISDQVTAILGASTQVIGHVIVDSAPTTAVTNTNLDVALSTRLKPADTLAGVTTVGTITNPVTVIQGTGTSLHTVVDSAPTTAVTCAGCATAGNQTGGSQKTQIVDGSGNVASQTANALDINVKSPTNTALPAATDSGLVARIIPQERAADMTVGALNDAVSMQTLGMVSFGGIIEAGTCSCTITPQTSYDNGSTWIAGQLVRHDTGGQAFSITLTNPNAAVPVTIYVTAGSTNVRLIVTAYTSGSTDVKLRASTLQDEVSMNLTAGVPGILANSRAEQIAGADKAGNIARRLVVDNLLPGNADYGASVRQIPQERSSGDTTLGSMSATVSVDVTGFQSYGGSYDAGTCSCTLSFQASYDSGVTWGTTAVLGPLGTQVTQIVLTNPNSRGQFEFIPAGQTTQVRVLVSAYTSGSLTARIRASSSLTQSVNLSNAQIGTATPFYGTVVAGTDGTNVRALQTKNSANAGTEYAAIVQLSSLGNTIKGTVGIDQTTPGTTNAVSATIATDSVGLAKEAGGHLANVDTNTAPLVAPTAGGYVRQDSTATIAKETGGNLATIATNSGTQATAANQTTGNASLSTIAGAVDTPGTSSPTSVVVVGGTDQNQNTTTLLAPNGVLLTQAPQLSVPASRSLRQLCNGLRKTNCQ